MENKMSDVIYEIKYVPKKYLLFYIVLANFKRTKEGTREILEDFNRIEDLISKLKK